MPSLLDTLAAAIFTYAVHSAAACAIALAAGRVLRRPHDRDVVWKTALVAPFVTTTIACIAAMLGNRGAFVDIADWVRRASPLAMPGRQVMVKISDDGTGPTILRQFFDPVTTGLTIFALVAAGACAGVAIVRFVVRRRALSSALAARRPVGALAGAGQGSTIRLSASDDLNSPVAVGLAEICLPAAVLAEFSDAHQQSLIAHEMAHLERRDPVWFFAAESIAALSAFQPLIFLVARAFRRDVELICDEAAFRRTNDRIALLGALARLASPFDPRAELYGAATAYDGSPLVARAARIATLSASVPGGRRHAAFAVAALIVALCAIPVFSSAPRASDFPADPLLAAFKGRTEGRRVVIDSMVRNGDHFVRRTIVRVN